MLMAIGIAIADNSGRPDVSSPSNEGIPDTLSSTLDHPTDSYLPDSSAFSSDSLPFDSLKFQELLALEDSIEPDVLITSWKTPGDTVS